MLWKWPDVRHIYLSAHLDDVILSCGGMISRQTKNGESVGVITIFAGSPAGSSLAPFAQELHTRWREAVGLSAEFSDLPKVRREEDRQSFGVISSSIQVIHASHLDCIYRVGPDGDWIYPTLETVIGAEIDPADPGPSELTQIDPLPPDAILYVPLAIGRHIDHQVLRNAVEGWELGDHQLIYYEDYPYAEKDGAIPAALEGTSWDETVIPLEKEDITAKIEGIAQHRSQLDTYWPTHEALVEAVSRFAEWRGGEVLRTKSARNAQR